MRFVDEFGVNIVGGCCGTMPEHLKMLVRCASAKADATYKPRNGRRRSRRSPASYSAEDIRQDSSYLIVAERTNTNGSRQVQASCCRRRTGTAWSAWPATRSRRFAHAGRVRRFRRPRRRARHARSRAAIRATAINAPLMLDSTNPAVMEAGLKLAGGRCVINSMNLEDGEEQARRRSASWRRSTARPSSPARSTKTSSPPWPAPPSGKSAIAKRIRDLAVEKYGLRDEDIAVRSAGAADQHGHRGGPPQRAGDDRRHAADHARSCRSATRSSGCRTSASA